MSRRDACKEPGRPGHGQSRNLEATKSSRLREVVVDPLEEYGLPSKGETRLNEHDTQEAYFALILSRVEQQSRLDKSRIDGLADDVASLAIDHTLKVRRAAPPIHSYQELPDIVVMAMRKVREGIVASKRADAFAQDVYKFIIRSTIRAEKREAYHPALLYLLRSLDVRSPLSEQDRQELAGYLVLDLACFQNDLNAAYMLQRRYELQDRTIRDILHALARENWDSYWKSKHAATVCQWQLTSYADERMRRHVGKCLTKTYFTCDRDFIEKALDLDRESLSTSIGNFNWQIEDEMVVIRKLKPR
ncbi:MAG: hypothetical protein M1828_003346 [Chrysothrix sp. TS-e1954]|nr:MAG: hypothetical protein M1828_003346 [Chrysothrix sp. TS-e1954]